MEVKHRSSLTAKTRAAVLIGVVLFSVALDQATKYVARATLAYRPPRWLLGGLVIVLTAYQLRRLSRAEFSRGNAA